jgi:aspartyl-tRNA synthetase
MSASHKSNRKQHNPLAVLELHVEKTQILNSVASNSLPFDPLDTHTPTREEVRMKHRYLDLRSDKLGDNIRLRSKLSWAIRDYLHRLGKAASIEYSLLVQLELTS